MIDELILSGVVSLVGLLLHMAMKWAEHRREVAPVSFRGYVAEVPAQTMVAILSSVGAFAVLYGVEWLNPGSAFAAGYMGNSVAENLARQFSAGVGK